MNALDLRTPRGIAIAICAAITATVLVAFAIPAGISGSNPALDGPRGLAGDLGSSAAEDLNQFAGSVRWGVSLEEILDTVAAEDRARRGLNPVLKRMGFLGLVESGDVTAVLLATPESDGGGIIEVSPGEILPDGRILTAVTDNSITLTSGSEVAGDTGDPEEVLLLFPRGEPEPETGQDS